MALGKGGAAGIVQIGDHPDMALMLGASGAGAGGGEAGEEEAAGEYRGFSSPRRPSQKGRHPANRAAAVRPALDLCHFEDIAFCVNSRFAE